MNRIEIAVTAVAPEVTRLELDPATSPVATPWAVAGVTLAAAGLGYQVGYHLGSLQDGLEEELSAPERLDTGLTVDELMHTRSIADRLR